MLIAICQLLGRSLAYALIAVSVGKRYVTLVVALEVVMFILYKLARQDYYYTGLSRLACFFIS
jgi:hypothetical protein